MPTFHSVLTARLRMNAQAVIKGISWSTTAVNVSGLVIIATTTTTTDNSSIVVLIKVIITIAAIIVIMAMIVRTLPTHALFLSILHSPYPLHLLLPLIAITTTTTTIIIIIIIPPSSSSTSSSSSSSSSSPSPITASTALSWPSTSS